MFAPKKNCVGTQKEEEKNETRFQLYNWEVRFPQPTRPLNNFLVLPPAYCHIMSNLFLHNKITMQYVTQIHQMQQF